MDIRRRKFLQTGKRLVAGRSGISLNRLGETISGYDSCLETVATEGTLQILSPGLHPTIVSSMGARMRSGSRFLCAWTLAIALGWGAMMASPQATAAIIRGTFE